MKSIIEINKKLLKKTVLFGVCLLILDGLWLNFFMKQKYLDYFRSIKIGMSIDKLSIFIVYLIMIVSYPLLIDNRGGDKGLMNAVSVGFIIFGTYGFTLAAIFPKYDIKFALTETIWGIVLYAVSYLATNYLIKFLS